MTINEVVAAIKAKHQQDGITVKAPATAAEIYFFEQQVGFQLPDDFREFYTTCNGFECTEDIFNILSLNDILNGRDDYGKGWFHFAEYMIFSDLWSLRNSEDGICEIYSSGGEEIVFTNSLKVFLIHFLQGNVFEKGGLYDWQEKVRKD